MSLTRVHGESCGAAKSVKGRTDAICVGGHADDDDGHDDDDDDDDYDDDDGDDVDDGDDGDGNDDDD
eukprot:5971141-Karenia_brevis.AAC.1